MAQSMLIDCSKIASHDNFISNQAVKILRSLGLTSQILLLLKLTCTVVHVRDVMQGNLSQCHITRSINREFKNLIKVKHENFKTTD